MKYIFTYLPEPAEVAVSLRFPARVTDISIHTTTEAIEVSLASCWLPVPKNSRARPQPVCGNVHVERGTRRRPKCDRSYTGE